LIRTDPDTAEILQKRPEFTLEEYEKIRERVLVNYPEFWAKCKANRALEKEVKTLQEQL
jgi:hypothetical protein